MPIKNSVFSLIMSDITVSQSPLSALFEPALLKEGLLCCVLINTVYGAISTRFRPCSLAL
jgi:hypothetical protein